MFRPTTGAKPNTSIVVKGARLRQMSMVEEYKSQGNSYFVSFEYSNAIEQYTRCINAIDTGKDLDTIEDPQRMKMLVLSNRAQAYLKLKAYGKAYDDANRACLIDSTHVKSVGRRGTAAYYLGNLRQA